VRGLPARRDERSERCDREPVTAGFEGFFRDHYPVIVRLAQQVVGDSQAAQDVAQEVFLAAYRRFPDDYGPAAVGQGCRGAYGAYSASRRARRDRRHLLVPGVCGHLTAARTGSWSSRATPRATAG
jgi:hypothetical protein